MTQPAPTLYDLLEVSPKASAEVVRAAYKSLIQRYHPDKHPDAALAVQAAERASQVVQAYEVLGHPERRAAYDQQLLAQARPAAAYGEVDAALRARVLARGRAAPARSSWPAWVLIGVIVVAASLLLALPKKRAVPAAAAPAALHVDAAIGTTTANPGAAAAPAGESAADSAARHLPAFATSLTIDLADVSASGTPHVLVIPELGFRLQMAEPQRWQQKIEGQRTAVLTQMLDRLAHARYDELVKPDGDLYLKRLVSSAVLDSIAWEEPAPATANPDAAPAPRPLETLLPQRYTVR